MFGIWTWANPNIRLFEDESATCAREVSVGSITVVYEAVALAGMTLLFTAHRAVMNTGFTISRQRLTTDTIVSLSLTVLSTTWTTIVLVSGFRLDDRVCLSGVLLCLARAAYCPWPLQILCLFWLISYGAFRGIPSKVRYLWKLDSSLGAYGWRESMNKTFLTLFYCLAFAVIAVTSYGAFREEKYTLGFLNLVGFALSLSGAAGGKNEYCTVPHICKGDMIISLWVC